MTKIKIDLSESLTKYAWVPLPLIIAATVVLGITGSKTGYESVKLMIFFNLVFSVIISFYVAHLIGTSFSKKGSPGLLLFAAGVLVWGVAGITGAVSGGNDENMIITVHNCCVWVSALFNLTGALLTFGTNRIIRNTFIWLTGAYLVCILIVALIVYLAIQNYIPVFYTHGQGGTVLRYMVLGSAIIMFSITSILLISFPQKPLSSFIKWYTLALSLITIGLIGVMFAKVSANPLSWTGRGAQYLSGIYMFIAAIASNSESNGWSISLQAALHKSEEKYRYLFENMTEAFAILEILFDKNKIPCDLLFVEVNPAFEEHTGLRTKEILGKTTLELFPKMENNWIEKFRNMALTGEAVQFEDWFEPLNKFFQVTGYYTGSNQIATIFRDITERKNSEEKLKHAREKLNIALENGNIGTWEWNLLNDEMIWDERMEKISGIAPEMIKNYTTFENCINPEDLQHFRKAVNDVLESDRPFETVFRTSGVAGGSRYISTKALVNRDSNGLPVSMNGVCFDITGMKLGTEKVLIKLNEELLRSNKDLQQFAYVASHDLQEPLRMVSSFTQLLAQRYENLLDNDGREYIRYAVEGSQRMYELINGLLAYSRVQTKGKELIPVDMNEVLKKVINNLSLKIKDKNAIVKIKKLPVIFADENQMVQLFQNLISNAMKFSDKPPLIRISSEPEERKYIFTVNDEGIGIDPQYFERIFLIFQRLMPKSDYEGTGIGLAICKRIVERHGGEIWVESVPGKGSTFLFSIPRQEISARTN